MRKIKSWKEKMNDDIYNLSLRVKDLELEREKILVDMIKQKQVVKNSL